MPTFPYKIVLLGAIITLLTAWVIHVKQEQRVHPEEALGLIKKKTTTRDTSHQSLARRQQASRTQQHSKTSHLYQTQGAHFKKHLNDQLSRTTAKLHWDQTTLQKIEALAAKNIAEHKRLLKKYYDGTLSNSDTQILIETITLDRFRDEIESILTDQDLANYEEFRESTKNRAIENNSLLELASLPNHLLLSKEQKDAIYQIFDQEATSIAEEPAQFFNLEALVNNAFHDTSLSLTLARWMTAQNKNGAINDAAFQNLKGQEALDYLEETSKPYIEHKIDKLKGILSDDQIEIYKTHLKHSL